jgi:hypothetical protein
MSRRGIGTGCSRALRAPGALLVAAGLIAVFGACGSTGAANEQNPPAEAVGPTSPPPSAQPTSTAPPGPGPGTPCAGRNETCSAFDTRSYCVETGAATEWRTEKCAEGCYAGKCSVTACADECVLGSTCKLWDMKARAFTPANPIGTLHDRARDYDKTLRAIDMPEGQVMNAHFADATRQTLTHYGGYRDAAIWTGSALAAQAWRLMTTGAPDAAKQVDALVRTLHRSFTISGDPGYLVRVAVPSNTTMTTSPPLCADIEAHCNVPYQGKMYNWVGGTSRDQNTGVMLGLYVAYLATTDESLKQLIRQDIVAMVQELMKVRKGVPAVIIVNGIPLNKSLDLENVILAPSEMQDGKIRINLDTDEVGENEMDGAREFFPDFSVLVKQVLGVGLPIPRPSTSIMIGAFFQLGLLVTDGVPAMAAVRKQINDYYVAHANAWLSIAAGWNLDPKCGKGYFANHIAFIMAHVYAMLEKDPVRSNRIRNEILDGAMWGDLKGHKNSYFAFLWGATRATPAKDAIDAAVAQLAQFEPGPRVHIPRNNVAAPQYLPLDTTCTAEPLCNTTTLAVDVKDRHLADFLWQRQPWQLSDGGDLTEVYPGVDYLAAYWAARHHGFVAEDRPGTCTRLSP